MTPASGQFETCGVQENPPAVFRAVVFYENRAAGHFARRALDLMEGQMGLPHQEIVITLWRLDVADMADVRDQVEREVAAADLILIAAGDAGRVAKHLLKNRGKSPDAPNLLLLDPAERLLCDASIECLRQSNFEIPRAGGGPGADWSRRSCA